MPIPTTVQEPATVYDVAELEALGKVGQIEFARVKGTDVELVLGGQLFPTNEAMPGTTAIRFTKQDPQTGRNRYSWRQAQPVATGTYIEHRDRAQAYAEKVSNPKWRPVDAIEGHPLLARREVTAISPGHGHHPDNYLLGDGSVIIPEKPAVEGLVGIVELLETRFRISFEVVGDSLLVSSLDGRGGVRGDIRELVARLEALIVGLKSGRRIKCLLCPIKGAKDAETILEVNVPACADHAKAPRKP